jgi:hypothetical protein
MAAYNSAAFCSLFHAPNRAPQLTHLQLFAKFSVFWIEDARQLIGINSERFCVDSATVFTIALV